MFFPQKRTLSQTEAHIARLERELQQLQVERIKTRNPSTISPHETDELSTPTGTTTFETPYQDPSTIVPELKITPVSELFQKYSPSQFGKRTRICLVSSAVGGPTLNGGIATAFYSLSRHLAKYEPFMINISPRLSRM